MRDITIFFLVLIFSTVGHIATDIYLASMPVMAEYFGTSNSVIQLSFSAYLLSFCITPLIIGPISDRIGRKKPILGGIYLSLLATLACMFANTAYFLIFARFLQGIGTGIIVGTGRAIAPDYFKGERLRKFFSYSTTLSAIILAVAPSLGGVIQELSSWRMVFGVMSLYILIILALAKFIYQESENTNLVSKDHKQNTIPYYFNTYKELLFNFPFMLYSGCTVLTVMGIIIYLTSSPFLFQQGIGLSAKEYGFTATFVCGIIFISGIVNTRLIRHFKAELLLYVAAFLSLFSGGLFISFYIMGSVNLYTILFSVLFFCCSMPISFANAGPLGLSCTKGNFGSVMALVTTLQFLGGVFGSTLVSFIPNFNTFTLGIIYIVIGSIYGMLLFLLKSHRRLQLSVQV